MPPTAPHRPTEEPPMTNATADTTDPLAAAADAMRDTANENQAAAAEAAEVADRLQARAAEAAEYARRAQLRADQGGSRPLFDAMRDLGNQIDDAKAEAVQALTNGGDPLRAWIAYRLTAARVLGEWDTLAHEYTVTTGRAAPPGPQSRVTALPAYDATGARIRSGGRVEGFEAWLCRTLGEAAKSTRQTARADTAQRIKSSRTDHDAD